MARQKWSSLTVGGEDSTVEAFVAIPTPAQLGRRAGVSAMNTLSHPVSTRLHKDDIPFIIAEANACGMTRGEFMRWATVFVAQQLHKKRTGLVRRINP